MAQYVMRGIVLARRVVLIGRVGVGRRIVAQLLIDAIIRSRTVLTRSGIGRSSRQSAASRPSLLAVSATAWISEPNESPHCRRADQ